MNRALVGRLPRPATASMPEAMWRKLRTFDWLMTLAVAAAVAFGVAMIYSATLRGGMTSVWWEDYVYKQIVFAALGLVLYGLVSASDYRTLAAFALPLYGVFVAALGLVLVFGVTVLGARRGFQIGILTIQPSELMKVVMIVALSAYYSRYDVRRPRVLLGAIGMIAVPVGLILMQPNLSTAVVLSLIWLGITFAAGARMLHLGLLVLPAGPLIALSFRMGLLYEHWLARFADMIVPGYQSRQALIAVGNGGLLGIGYAQGSQSQGGFVPVLHSDAIYALIAEELGVVGSAVAVALLGFIVLRILRSASTALDSTGALICTGVATYLFGQALIHIGVVLQVVPPTGLSLPFMSYGGSSLLTAMVALGLVQSVRMCRRPLEFS
ncbi:MAG: rod shape-determining protein RodA [Ardenticatenales bacterium]|nr:rod shape-determining protein RodA [Ardenticatenales bacterium]